MNIENLSFCTEVTDEQASTINGGIFFDDYGNCYYNPSLGMIDYSYCQTSVAAGVLFNPYAQVLPDYYYSGQ